MDRRARRQAILYYTSALLWLAVMVFLVIFRIRASGDFSQLATGLIVVVSSAGITLIAVTAVTWPAAAARNELRRRFPDALVENVQRNPIRPLLRAVTPDATPEGGSFRTVVANEHGLSIWRRVDRATNSTNRLEKSVLIRWPDILNMDISLQGSRQPMYSVDVTAQQGPDVIEFGLIFSSQPFGGTFPASAATTRGLFDRLEDLRSSNAFTT